MFKKQIEPSLLAFDINNIDKQLLQMQNLQIKTIHYDVMNKSYVNNTAFGTEWINVILNYHLSINVHIMALDPIAWIKEFINYPISAITFHYEPLFDKDTIKYLDFIKQHNIQAGIAIKPYSLPISYQHLLNYCDLVTIMSVEPGKGGQPFIKNTILNLIFIFNYRLQHNLNYMIQVDGGINIDTIDHVIQYADNFIIGSGFVKQPLEVQVKIINKIKEQNEKNQ